MGGTATGSVVGGLSAYNIFYPPTVDLKFRGTFREDGFVEEVRIDRALCTPAPKTRTEIFYVNPRDLTRVQFFIMEGGDGDPVSAVDWLTKLSKGPVEPMKPKGSGYISMADFRNLGKPMIGSDHITIKPDESRD
jgi:hypothetical protein